MYFDRVMNKCLNQTCYKRNFSETECDLMGTQEDKFSSDAQHIKGG